MTKNGKLKSALADRYKIEGELGQGGMATVYLAHDLRHDRKVAVKVLRPELAAALGSDRFLSEIRTTAKLNHPHILALHDSGDADGFLFYVMPLVEGESLRERMTRDKTLPVEEAVRLTREVADALAYAHAHDVIHRDIKPENILLQSGHAVVADFGIARAVRAAASDRITMTGMAVGTPAYMSPEQSAGERDVDGRSDLYALASVLYEMLAGEAPFTGATMDAILVQRFTRPAPRVSTKRPNVSRNIDAAISRAMARAPEDRFATVERFAASLVVRTGSQEVEPLDRSIAVLPFANMSGDPENEYFSDGISEDIINALTQLAGLRVAARTSAFSFKGKNIDLRTIGDELNVATVLEGSVRRAGGRIRITAQLINVADGYHLWSERYDRELTDVFAIQDEIATVIAEKLKVTLGVGTEGLLVRPPTANVDAYDLYLKGHSFIKQRGPALLRAVESFEKAIALDPRLALAHAELAEALLLMALYGMVQPAGITERAKAATLRALELEPTLVTGQIVLGLFSLMAELDRDKASAAFARAVELDPADVEARTLQAVFDLCYVKGEHEAAQAQLRGVIESDPLSANARAQLALLLAWAGKTDEALVQARRGIELDPGAFYPNWTAFHALALGPNPLEAIALAPSLLSRFGRHAWLMMGLSYAYGILGKRDKSEALYSELEARARSEYVQPTALAAAAVGAGRNDKVYLHLRDAAKVRDPLLVVLALHWPGFAKLRPGSGFTDVLRQMGWQSRI
ncbi:MAG TPA: protein kinase [Gemmatimonadales bacterium]|nr:protein kinase [Gemmatimonadales bacterium]